MWISGTSQYAIRAVVFVAGAGGGAPVRVGEVAKALQVPRNYLSKTLHALSRDGVLTSTRGPRGGFRLAVPPGQLTLARVAAPFDDVDSKPCLLGRTQCSGRRPCAAHAQWGAVSAALQQFFSRTTIADLMDGGRRATARRLHPPAAARRARVRDT